LIDKEALNIPKEPPVKNGFWPGNSTIAVSFAARNSCGR
jgi:hypothetical protein